MISESAAICLFASTCEVGARQIAFPDIYIYIYIYIEREREREREREMDNGTTEGVSC
jgi:hypothetical protein